MRNEFEEKCDLVTAKTGEEAIEILEDPVRGNLVYSNQFDLVMTDINMPGMSGLEVSQYIRKKNRVNRFTPVILLTTEQISKETVREMAAQHIFPKQTN